SHRRSCGRIRVTIMSEPSAAAQDNPGVIAPPPLIGLVTLLLGLLADWLYPTHVLSGLIPWPIRGLIGAVVCVAGGALAVVARRTFQRIGTNVKPWEPTLKLATFGVYKKLRNPMYVGVFVLLFGLALVLASDWLLLLIVPSALLIHFGVVLREERY